MQESPPAARTVRYLLFGAKVALSAALIVFAFSKIDLAEAGLQIRSISASALAGTIALLLIQASVAAFRLRQILKMVGAGFRFIQALEIVFIGAFFSQTLISFVGGDAMRIWRIARSNVSLGLATKVVVLDRTAGLAGTIGLVLVTLPFLPEVVSEPAMRRGLLIALASGITGFAFLVSMGHLRTPFRENKLLRWVSDFAQDTISLMRSTKHLASLLSLSLIIQAFNVISLYILARGLSVEITFWHSLLLIPPVLFLSMLPISFSGWGVREGAMIVALGLVGVAPARSVALSVCFGLSLIVISMPGAFLWLLQREQTIPATSAVNATSGGSEEIGPRGSKP